MSSRIDPVKGLRISYTALSLWERGDTEGFLNYINGVAFTPTPQMLEGQKYDNACCAHAVQHKRLTPEFGWYELNNPQPQLKLEVQMVSSIGKPFTLVGVLDIYDEGDIWELKTGVMSSISYARTKQTRLYMLLCQLSGLPVKRIRIARYDQYHNKTDVHIVLPSKYITTQVERELKQQVAGMQTFLEAMKGGGYEYTN